MKRHKAFSKIVALDFDSPENSSFRNELWLVGAEHGCRYYLSMLKDRDYYFEDHDQFASDIAAYVSQEASRLAVDWSTSYAYYDVLLPLLQNRFNAKFGLHEPPSNEHRALIALVEHPDWSDAQIAAQIQTTEEQLHRFSVFRLAREEQRRSHR